MFAKKVKRPVAMLATLTMLFAVSTFPQSAQAVIVDPESVNVMDCGALGNGVRDDTAAFNKAIEKAEELEVPVFVPGGRYFLSDSITLDGVSLVGMPAASWTSDGDNLPQLLIYHTKGPAVVLNGGTVSGLRFIYSPDAAERNKTPDTIRVTGHDSQIVNVKINEAAVGIKVDGTAIRGLVIQNIFMCNLHNTGIYLNGTVGAVVKNVEVWTPDTSSPFVSAGIGLYMQGNEELTVESAFIFMGNIGYYFENNDKGEHTNVVMTNCMLDMMNFGMEIHGDAQVELRSSTFYCHNEGLRVMPGAQSDISVYGNAINTNGSYVLNILGGKRANFVGNTVNRSYNEQNTPVVYIGVNGVYMQGNTIVGNMKKDATTAVVSWNPDVRTIELKYNIVNTTNNAKAFSATAAGVHDNVAANRTGEIHN